MTRSIYSLFHDFFVEFLFLFLYFFAPDLTNRCLKAADAAIEYLSTVKERDSGMTMKRVSSLFDLRTREGRDTKIGGLCLGAACIVGLSQL